MDVILQAEYSEDVPCGYPKERPSSYSIEGAKKAKHRWLGTIPTTRCGHNQHGMTGSPWRKPCEQQQKASVIQWSALFPLDPTLHKNTNDVPHRPQTTSNRFLASEFLAPSLTQAPSRPRQTSAIGWHGSSTLLGVTALRSALPMPPRIPGQLIPTSTSVSPWHGKLRGWVIQPNPTEKNLSEQVKQSENGSPHTHHRPRTRPSKRLNFSRQP